MSWSGYIPGSLIGVERFQDARDEIARREQIIDDKEKAMPEFDSQAPFISDELTLLDQSVVIEDQKTTIEGLGQQNTELEAENGRLREYDRLTVQTMTRLRATIHQAVEDVRALRDVPISQLDSCITDVVDNLIEGCA